MKFRRSYRPGQYLSKNSGSIKLCAAIVIISFLIYTLDGQLRPIIKTYAEYQSRITSVLTINEAVMEELEKEGVGYDQLVEISRKEDGSVASIQANSLAINRLQANLTQAVSERLKLLNAGNVGVPLGTVLGLQFFSGRGPVIHFRIQPASYVQSEIVNRLESAGINQTQHRIFIRLKVDMVAILPGFSTSTTVENEVCIAQTLIIGAVPETYADLIKEKNLQSEQESGQ